MTSPSDSAGLSQTLALAIALVLCALCGCGPDPTTPVKLVVYQPEEGSNLFDVWFGIGPDGASCQFSVSANATAEMNGTPLELKGRGGPGRSEGIGAHATVEICKDLVATGSVPASPDGVDELILRDGSTVVVRARFQSMLAPRSVELLGPSNEIREGDQVTLQWSPSTDTYVRRIDTVTRNEVDFEPDPGQPSTQLFPSDFTVHGSLVSFRARQFGGIGGDPSTGRLVINPEWMIPKNLTCEGLFNECAGEVRFVSASAPVTRVP